jgi:hypothetical protein
LILLPFHILLDLIEPGQRPVQLTSVKQVIYGGQTKDPQQKDQQQRYKEHQFCSSFHLGTIGISPYSIINRSSITLDAGTTALPSQ